MAKMKPPIWYTYCQLESMIEGEVVKGHKIQVAGLLDITVPTLSKYLAIWESQGLVREIPDGFVITQLDGSLNPEVMTKEELPPRQYIAKKVIDYWCSTYENHYEEPCRVGNWGMTMGQAKRLLSYTDIQIERTIDVVIALYERKWASAKFPRPTFGALASFLFEQAMPYADMTPTKPEKEEITPSIKVIESETNFLDDSKAKGWL